MPDFADRRQFLKTATALSAGWLLSGRASGREAPPRPADSWVNPPKEQIPGVQHKTFHSNILDTDVGYNIYLPPGYDGGDARYPVVYYLHGMGDDENTHLGNVRVLDVAIKNKEVRPMIYVYTNTGRRSWFCDSADGKVPRESLVIKELIPHVDKTYRTIADRKGRGLQGFSMGGFGAVKFALKYPDLFSSTVAHSGAYLDSRGLDENQRGVAMLRGVLGDDRTKLEENTPFALARKKADLIRGKVAIRLDCGSTDGLLSSNRDLHKLLGELKIPHEFEEVPGVGHDPKVMYTNIGFKGFQFNARHFVP